ncbi:MAG: tyrosine-type recombinase/integrase [Tannerella sp.]|nr:tyrosine-type recombinase/integrase [Tannerella sp.]
MLNREECKRLFHTPQLLRHRLILALMYSGGLRVSGLRALQTRDIDSGRMTIHISFFLKNSRTCSFTVCFKSLFLFYGYFYLSVNHVSFAFLYARLFGSFLTPLLTGMSLRDEK